MRVACIQYKAYESEEQTLKKILPLVHNAVKKNVDLITLPECATFLNKNKSETMINASYEEDSYSLKIIKETAKTFNVNILIGSLQTLENKKSKIKLFNRSFLINNKGIINCKYDKIHMYDVKISENQVYNESKIYESGETAKIAELKINGKYFKIGMTICYDIRFPNLFRDLAIHGADIITVPSVFMYITGKDHWHSLLKARAIETGCYIVAPAQCGEYFNNRRSYGHSSIISPWGKILSDAKTSKNIIISNIDKNEITKARSKIPSIYVNKKYKIN
ncbi:hypothetical protein OA253_01410 [Alphaproteobacteria bacterium]|nr:hypothetical protein [Alphaproteobacteria bacterium]